MRTLKKSRMAVISFTALLAIGCAILYASKTPVEATKRYTIKPTPPVTTNFSTNYPVQIDGSTNPSAIPDEKAFSMLFRFLARRDQPSDLAIARDFITQVGLEGSDIDSLLDVTAEFGKQVEVLDHKALEIHTRNRSNLSSEAMNQLISLQQEKETLVINFVSSLPNNGFVKP